MADSTLSALTALTTPAPTTDLLYVVQSGPVDRKVTPSQYFGNYIAGQSATALAVGRLGSTTPALLVNTNTASSVTGIQIVSAAAAGGCAVSVISSGADESLTLDAKGAGTITIAGTSTGSVTITRALLVSGVLSAGTSPTTLTDAAGKVLSAALNTVAVGQGGTGLTSGTSGGVLAYTASGTLASSAALAANQLVLGGGAGVVPATLGSLGSTVTVLHGNAGGAPTFGAVVLTTDVSGILPTANGGTGMAFFTVAGPTTARIYTFPDAAATVLTTNAAVTVAQGGTGIASGTSGGIPYFSGTTTIASSGALTASALVLGGGAGATPTSLALGTANQILGMNSGATAHEYKSFAVGTSGTDFAVAHSANTVTFNLPDAGASARGAVTTGTQTFAGAKTFSGAVDFSSTATVAGNLLQGGAAGAATTAVRLLIKKTGIADNTATDVITVTVPNANHAACIKLRILSSNGSTDAFESSRCAEGMVVLTRTTGVATVAAVATLDLAQIATVAAGATHTLAYGVSAMTGAASATQTFTIQLTIDDSGNVGSNQAVILAELINAEATGVTMAAA